MLEVRRRIVDAARSYFGVPYKGIYQGTGPEDGGFTCSGLVWRAYSDAGLDIPICQGIHSYYTGSYNGWNTQAGWLISNGHLVTDTDDLLPGDIVLYSPVGDIMRTGHVAIYSGDGMVVHANGAPVDETPLGEGGVFVGGGWPLPETPEEVERQKEKLRRAKRTMSCLIHISDENTWVWKEGDNIHDLTDEDEMLNLINVYAAENGGKSMPTIEMTGPWYARLVQSCKAGLPKHLKRLNELFPPRSPR